MQQSIIVINDNIWYIVTRVEHIYVNLNVYYTTALNISR